MRLNAAVTLCVVALLAPGAAQAFWFVDSETGAAFCTLNDVSIPGDDGTRFSLAEDLQIDPGWYFRLRVGNTIAGRHSVFMLAAPLTLRAQGELESDVEYDGVHFAAGEKVRATYRFDSYRLTYRYDFLLEPLELGAGLTVKVRDAAIALDGLEYAEYTNTGLVPLINFRLYWNYAAWAGLLLEGDALAGPQGRAEDVQMALTADLSESVRLRLGYRLLEGGADNDKVYTFALIHYAGAGIEARF